VHGQFGDECKVHLSREMSCMSCMYTHADTDTDELHLGRSRGLDLGRSQTQRSCI
jgi:hypothetical protein